MLQVSKPALAARAVGVACVVSRSAVMSHISGHVIHVRPQHTTETHTQNTHTTRLRKHREGESVIQQRAVAVECAVRTSLTLHSVAARDAAFALLLVALGRSTTAIAFGVTSRRLALATTLANITDPRLRGTSARRADLEPGEICFRISVYKQNTMIN
jgi:hypothetical protein